MSGADRYCRQRRLPEIGDEGQARIERLAVEILGRGEGAAVERHYLERAGVSSVELVPGEEPSPFAHGEIFRFEATRQVAAGAWRALENIRLSLGPRVA